MTFVNTIPKTMPKIADYSRKRNTDSVSERNNGNNNGDATCALTIRAAENVSETSGNYILGLCGTEK